MNKVPSEFTIHGHTIKITMVSELEDAKFGDYDCVKEEIRVAENIRRDSELIPLSDTQILATAWHEIFHAFQWHSGKEYSETESQTYAGLMIEFLNTKKDE